MTIAPAVLVATRALVVFVRIVALWVARGVRAVRDVFICGAWRVVGVAGRF